MAHKRTVDLKKRSKASRLPYFGGKAIARGSDDSFGRRAIYGVKNECDRLGRADEILRLMPVLAFKIAKYYASRQESSARTRFFVGKRPTRSRPPTFRPGRGQARHAKCALVFRRCRVSSEDETEHPDIESLRFCGTLRMRLEKRYPGRRGGERLAL